nr:MAG TPA: hypothetical protein [Caudoviricetes sp.]
MPISDRAKVKFSFVNSIIIFPSLNTRRGNACK